ncbi:MAG: T9SS type A sorting domain-containing protein, partial [Prolixibacteraceae bacterium]|nr:T9SS type A sorting domain-containing protein [Prolixibacteraceae bacterium]
VPEENNAVIYIYKSNGELIDTWAWQSQQKNYSYAHLAKGIYVVQFMNNKQNLAAKFVVK